MPRQTDDDELAYEQSDGTSSELPAAILRPAELIASFNLRRFTADMVRYTASH